MTLPAKPRQTCGDDESPDNGEKNAIFLPDAEEQEAGQEQDDQDVDYELALSHCHYAYLVRVAPERLSLLNFIQHVFTKRGQLPAKRLQRPGAPANMLVHITI